jgi:hypothetical protein
MDTSTAGINHTIFMAISLICESIKIAKISGISNTKINAR